MDVNKEPFYYTQSIDIGSALNIQLTWDKHIDTIKTKANRSLGLVTCSKNYLPPDILTIMYRWIIEPHMRYCCSVWGCCRESNISTLQKIHSRAVRIVTSNPHDVSVPPILKDFG